MYCNKTKEHTHPIYHDTTNNRVCQVINLKKVKFLNLQQFDSTFLTQRKPENGKINRNPYISRHSDKLLTIREMAEILRCGRSKAYQLVRTGKIRKVVIQGSVFVKQSDLEEFIKNNTR